MRLRFLASLAFLPLLSCDPVAVFLPDQIAAGETFDATVRFAVPSTETAAASGCVAVPDTWATVGASFSGSITGDGVADAVTADLMNGTSAVVGYTWSCFETPSHDWTTGERLEATFSLTAAAGAPTGPVELHFSGDQVGVAGTTVTAAVTVGIAAPRIARSNAATNPAFAGEVTDVGWDGSRLYVVAGGQFYTSGDDGDNWVGLAGLNGEMVLGGGNVLVFAEGGGGATLYLSDDGGTSFYPEYGWPSAYTPTDVRYAGGGNYVAVASGPNGAALVASTDDGVTWTPTDTEASGFVGGKVAFGDGTWMAVTTDDGAALANTVAVSTDGGASWSYLATAPGASDVAWSQGAWFYSSVATGEVLTSTDVGASWSPAFSYAAVSELEGDANALWLQNPEGLAIATGGEDPVQFGGVFMARMEVEEGRLQSVGTANEVRWGYVSDGPSFPATPVALPDGEVGVTYEEVITFDPGYGEGELVVAEGSELPAGLVLDAPSRSVLGIPEAEGDYTFDLTHTDDSGRSATGTVSLTVQPEQTGPTDTGDDEPEPEPGGCGCTTSSSGASMLLLMPFALVVARRRRQ